MSNEKQIEAHPWPPFLPENAKLLMLGSFPPPRERWSMDFYYPNLNNDMWRIFGLVFFGAHDHFLTETDPTPAGKKYRPVFSKTLLEEFLSFKGIALGDTARSAVRHKGNASDKFLEIVETVDLHGLLPQIPECRTLVTTGDKAAQTLASATGSSFPSIGGFTEFHIGEKIYRHYRMPSSSRAYPKPLPEKAAVYKRMFIEAGIL